MGEEIYLTSRANAQAIRPLVTHWEGRETVKDELLCAITFNGRIYAYG